MPRIPYRDENDPEIGDLVDAIRARRKGSLIILDRMLLHSPPFAQGWNALLGAVRRNLELSPRVRELAICAVARLNKAEYEWHQHAPEFLAAGAAGAARCPRQRRVGVARDAPLRRRRARGAAPDDRDDARGGSERCNARELLGDRRLTELVGTIATYNMVSRFLVALGVDEKGE